jgi:exodeoxyribonuclease VII large subunit
MLPENLRIYSVADLTRVIKDHLETEFPMVWVSGEVSNLRNPHSGHCYFTLKDQTSQVRVVIFRSNLQALRLKPADSLKIICRGQLTVYEPRGEYQLIVDYLEPQGMGVLAQAFEQLKTRLAAEGLFDSQYKRPLPFLPRHLAVVTSPSGAALRDFLNIVQRRFPNTEVLVYPVRVQGQGASAEIAAAIQALNTMPDIEVIIVTRGGGSIEDLWAFNEEEVARAIFQSTIPVI